MVDEDTAPTALADSLSQLSLGGSFQFRFRGKSSGAMLVQTALDLRDEFTGEAGKVERKILSNMRPELWKTCAVGLF